MQNIFQIPIGDWSGDGHGQCEWYTVKSNKPVEAWREAYFKSQARWPELAPDGELSRTATGDWPRDRIGEVFGGSYRLDIDAIDGSSEGIALYTLAFCQLSDPALAFEHVPIPMLPFYGVDEQQRHIGSIGYELWM